MKTQATTFDWSAWYASIPGIPGDWGKPPCPRTEPVRHVMPRRPRPVTLRPMA